MALAGLDAETGVVMLLYLTLAHRRRERDGTLVTEDDWRETIVEGAAKRLRPKLMTVATMYHRPRAGPLEHRHALGHGRPIGRGIGDEQISVGLCGLCSNGHCLDNGHGVQP